jgi:hypothetical protein
MMESNPHDISVDEYVDAFREIETEMTSNQRTILLTHYQTPGFSATARELGRGFHYKSNAPVNRQYGALGKLLCEVLGVDERPYLNVLLWSDLNSRAEHKLTLYKEPAEAIRILGWAGDGEETAEGSSADEEGGSASGAVEFEYSALEGTRIERVSLDRARSDALRQRKIDDAKSKSGGRVRRPGPCVCELSRDDPCWRCLPRPRAPHQARTAAAKVARMLPSVAARRR